jgi:hypothetical protein
VPRVIAQKSTHSYPIASTILVEAAWRAGTEPAADRDYQRLASAEEVKKNHFIGIRVEGEVDDKRVGSCKPAWAAGIVKRLDPLDPFGISDDHG